MYCYHCMNQKGSAPVCPYCHRSNDGRVAAHHLHPGTVLNKKYLVGYAIGEGGFGITYIGRDTTLDVRVAIKEFYPSGYTNRNSYKEATVVFGTDKQRGFFEKGKQRFLLEARNVAKFSSEKGIVDVRDFFEANGTAYIIMEYLEGIDLDKYLNKYGPMPADKAFDLMLPVMRSLEKINAAGIIHRDISPDNIMYLTDGSLKLTDFGSARYFTNNDKEMSIMLKQGYAPEEQYTKNGNQGPWTDVYGMCATIYRCITGEVPESGIDRIHTDDLLPPSQLGVRISPALESVLMYGLAVFKENRCQNMTELIDLVNKARADGRVNIYPVGGAVLSSYAADGAYRERVYGDERNRTYGDNFAGEERHPEKQPQDKQPEPEKKKKSSVAPILIISIIAVLLIIGIIVLFVFGGDIFGKKKSESSPEPTAATVLPTVEPTEAPTEAADVEIPDVTGIKLTQAKEQLEEAGLSWDVDTIQSDMTQNYVVKQIPEAGSYVRPGTKVTLLIPDEPEEQPTEEETEAPTVPDDTYYNCSTGKVYLHKNPSRTSASFMEIPSGASVTYLEKSGEYYKVRCNLFSGYVLAKYFSKDPDAGYIYDEEYQRQMNCTNNVTLYYNPSTSSASFELKENAEVNVVGYLSNEDFYEIIYNGTLCYLPKDPLDTNFEDINP